jgi:hypothetical protein
MTALVEDWLGSPRTGTWSMMNCVREEYGVAKENKLEKDTKVAEIRVSSSGRQDDACGGEGLT